MTKIGFIGGGNMAKAIIGGLKNNGADTSTILVIEPDSEKCKQLAQQFSVQASNNYDDIRNTGVLVLAVKPQQLRAVCAQVSPLLNSQLVISIAAGVRSADISRWLNGYQSVVRVMPNTPAQIQVGVSALYASTSVNNAQREQATHIMDAVGKTLWVDNEEKMDAVTAISGSGPAYVFYLIEALQEAGIQLGLNSKEANLLALETFAGASLLATQSADDVKSLRAQVTSKGGTTEQGILALENGNLKEIILKAAKAATDKSKALGDEIGKQ